MKRPSTRKEENKSWGRTVLPLAGALPLTMGTFSPERHEHTARQWGASPSPPPAAELIHGAAGEVGARSASIDQQIKLKQNKQNERKNLQPLPWVQVHLELRQLQPKRSSLS